MTLYDDGFFYEVKGCGRMSRVTADGLQPIDSIWSDGYLISLAKRGDSLYFGNLEANIILACDSAHVRLLRRSDISPEPLWLPTAYCAVVWQDNYLFATDLDFGLKVFGLDDPTSPNLIASLALPDDPFDLKVLGSRAYVAADQAGVIIVDVSNPQLPSMVSRFNVGGRSQQLAIAGTHLYVADQDRGLRIFSLEDPDNPLEVGYYNGGYGVQALCVHDSLVFACDTAYFMVLDCSQALPIGHVRSTELPYHFELLTNYPNPFNSQTVFRYRITDPSGATLRVYDLLGRIVWEYPLSRRNSGEGTVPWAGTNRSGNLLASGVYFCQLTNHHESKTIKIMMLR
ncbi:T9SS type A sorting domain-containing protein [bacterium]|nr:T9SS type A sorting domain-containing protein [bacterium]MBU1984751.1 T9SS type A sorting domain-containing protein [bacterium]